MAAAAPNTSVWICMSRLVTWDWLVVELDWLVVLLWFATCREAVRVGHEPAPMDNDWELFLVLEKVQDMCCLLSENALAGAALPKWQRISLVVVYEERTFFSGRRRMMNIFGKNKSERAMEADRQKVKLAVSAWRRRENK